jgi:hypothetical protein
MKKIIIIFVSVLFCFPIFAQEEKVFSETIDLSMNVKELFLRANSEDFEPESEDYYILNGHAAAIIIFEDTNPFKVQFDLINAEWEGTKTVNQYLCRIDCVGDEFKRFFYGNEENNFIPVVEKHSEVMVIGTIKEITDKNGAKIPIINAVYIRKL